MGLTTVQRYCAACDTAVLRFFKMADVRHLGFVKVRKFEILNASRVRRPNVFLPRDAH